MLSDAPNAVVLAVAVAVVVLDDVEVKVIFVFAAGGTLGDMIKPAQEFELDEELCSADCQGGE